MTGKKQSDRISVNEAKPHISGQRFIKEKEVFNMFEKKIVFTNTDDMTDFVNAAGRCDFEIDVTSGNYFVDAKSLLGVMYLGFARELTVQYAGKNGRFEHVLKRLCVA